MYGAESEDVIIPKYDRIYSLKDYIPEMMKEIRKDNEEKVILILDWSFFDYFRDKEEVNANLFLGPHQFVLPRIGNIRF